MLIGNDGFCRFGTLFGRFGRFFPKPIEKLEPPVFIIVFLHKASLLFLGYNSFVRGFILRNDDHFSLFMRNSTERLR